MSTAVQRRERALQRERANAANVANARANVGRYAGKKSSMDLMKADHGEHIEEIKVFENDDPNEIVKKFGNDFNLSQNARQRLLEQIQEQIQMDDY